ncbi:MAG: LysR family transcriptional regulator [Eubacteriales bacterium]
MNLLHLKYAVEVAEASSITKAAEKLYMGQPNLSRAIRELEDTLGIRIFKRTSKGIVPTPQGDEFLRYARKILSQVDAVEQLYRGERARAQRFSITVPRACYISCAFTRFVNKLQRDETAEVFYMETNSMRSVGNVANDDYKLGILRYPTESDRYFREMLEEKGLRAELICEFRYTLVMSREHPLAGKDGITAEELSRYIEVVHADPNVPSLPAGELPKETGGTPGTRVNLFERGSQLELLADVPDSFMWTSPIPPKILDRFGLVQQSCGLRRTVYRDMLICKEDYRFSPLDTLFIDELTAVKREVMGS